MPSGYSGTPLFRKLGLRENSVIVAINAPKEFTAWLDPIPEGVQFKKAANAATDIVHVFATERTALEHSLTSLRHTLRADAAVWVSWPKKASGVTTDIVEDTIREIALPLGFVDIKVCAVSDVWSGLKLVVRKELR